MPVREAGVWGRERARERLVQAWLRQEPHLGLGLRWAETAAAPRTSRFTSTGCRALRKLVTEAHRTRCLRCSETTSPSRKEQGQQAGPHTEGAGAGISARSRPRRGGMCPATGTGRPRGPWRKPIHTAVTVAPPFTPGNVSRETCSLSGGQ